MALVAFLIVRGLGGGSGTHAGGGAPASVLSARVAAEPLPSPVAGAAAVRVPAGTLVLGGLDSSESSVAGVFLLEPGGMLRPAGTLSGPLHDAAATVVGGRVLVFGGGTETSTDAVQELPASLGEGAEAVAAVFGHLPKPRSDLSAVTIGARAYVLGGYDGTELDPSVLSTTDGRAFDPVAELPVPARYLAAAALGPRIFAFGGETGEGQATRRDPGNRPRARQRQGGRPPAPRDLPRRRRRPWRLGLRPGRRERSRRTDRRGWRFDPASGRVTKAPTMPLAVAGAAAASDGRSAYLVGGTGTGGKALASVIGLRLAPCRRRNRRAARPPGPRAAPLPGRPDDRRPRQQPAARRQRRKQVLWRFPSRAHPAPPGGFYFPDDAFFIHGGTGIISNEEQNERIVQLAYPSGKLLWSYGHPGVDRLRSRATCTSPTTPTC